ncbi:MAG: hypothetical protein FWF20_00020 [Betaproteobacteria bacterium]|nr:hypothetical protein [Betaproteobacteria bacterium]MCL2885166.1 hypothetical protein [Betaproteobacteria bacterium]
MKRNKISALIFGVIVLLILCQAVTFHAWNTGALNLFVSVYQGFGQPIPSAMAFGLRTAKEWWLVPLLNALLLAFVSYSADSPKWLFVPLLASFATLTFMLYIMYSSPIKMGAG